MSSTSHGWRAQLADAAGRFSPSSLLPPLLELCTLGEKKACICHIDCSDASVEELVRPAKQHPGNVIPAHLGPHGRPASANIGNLKLE